MAHIQCGSEGSVGKLDGLFYEQDYDMWYFIQQKNYLKYCLKFIFQTYSHSIVIYYSL